ncbi:hypothetical protein LR48_Vigan08g075800 [Vigna angularis]|uniref:Uncharacterized protein n=1 Tax=Phaseolus angularis TaxID=3914 RepID=A0A0L9V4K1_PHAAN|nr:hypothetical protein LR48_Vigan08g075800 [Vigna angularis]
MASSSSSKRYKSVGRTERNASPTRWISDDVARNKFLCCRKIKKMFLHKSLILYLFSGEGFLFPNWLTHQGLAKFVQMKGDCYPELVEVFYNNLRVVNDDIHSRVKGVNIIINNHVWLLVAGLKVEGCMSHIKDSLHNKRIIKKQIYRDCLRYPGRYKGVKVSTPNFVRTIDGWVFSDVQNQSGNTEELSNLADDFISFSPKSKFERFYTNKFKKVSGRTEKMRKSLFKMENKLEELIKNYVDNSSSIEESSEDDKSSEENLMEESESE